MSTVTKCTCGHLISNHTYSEDKVGCDECFCKLDIGALVDKYQTEVTDRTAQNLKDTERINDLLSSLVLVERNYDALQSPMPCGHLARYAVNEKAGTQYCALCSFEAEKENNRTFIAELQALREFVSDVKETCELHESHLPLIKTMDIPLLEKKLETLRETL